MMAALRARLRAIFRSTAVDREMRQEMELHLAQATERLMGRGLSEAEARAAARREFGNVALLQEQARDARGARWIESLVADMRFAGRHFARTPVTVVTLVLVLSLGIGVNSAIFSVLQAFALRAPPAVAADDALVRVRGIRLAAGGRPRPRDYSMPELNAIAARRETFASIAGWAPDQLVLDLDDGSEPRVMRGHFVTPNYFATLGVRPALGPGLPTARTGDAPGAEVAVVIAHWLWDALGGEPAVIGRVVRVNGVPMRVAGVAPPKFQGPIADPDNGASLWVPLAARAALVRSTPLALVSRDSTLLQAIGRLTPNTTVAAATSVVGAVAAAWAPSEPSRRVTADGRDARVRGGGYDRSSDVVPLWGNTEVDADAFVALALALAGTGALLILLIVCTNVSALLVGAGVARRREIAIRLSLGASRLRVVRQLVTESSLIALTGGALGLLIYWSIMRLLTWTYGAYGDPGIGPDLGTVAFTACISLGTGVVFGLSPALHATGLDVAGALKSAGGGATSRSRLQRAFIVAQIALTQPLLIGLAMVIGITRSEFSSSRVDVPLAHRVTRVDFGAGGGTGPLNAKQTRVRDLMDRVARLPGVEGVVPGASGFDVGQLRVHPADRGRGPRAEEAVRAGLEGAPPGYFAFQSIPMLRGRDLAADDTNHRDMAVVIDNALARGFWGAADPIGKRLEVVSGRSTGSVTAVVVGVVDTARLPRSGAGRLYTAHGTHWHKDDYLIRTRGPGTAIIPSVRQLAQTVIPDIPIHHIATLDQIVQRERRDVLSVSVSAAGGGLLALLLASIGLYGLVALAVRQRHREIGIRVALGARPRQVMTMFFTSGLRLSVLGIVLGLPLSTAALHLLLSSFAGRWSNNMWLAGAAALIAAVVVGVASLATWIPARRAAAVDPLVAIRVE